MRKGRHGYDEGGDIERAKMNRDLGVGVEFGERREAIQNFGNKKESESILSFYNSNRTGCTASCFYYCVFVL